jgi:hypothetical protein
MNTFDAWNEMEKERKQREENAPCSEWISVKERLPEPGERVLYCYRGFVGEGYVTKSGEWERAGIWTRYYPSHWMPLPEPPEMFNVIKEKSKL